MIRVISGAQSRMARGLLKWSVNDLAEAAKVSTMTIKRIEKVDGVPNSQVATLQAIHDAFTATGRVRFEGEDGVFVVNEELSS